MFNALPSDWELIPGDNIPAKNVSLERRSIDNPLNLWVSGGYLNKGNTSYYIEVVEI